MLKRIRVRGYKSFIDAEIGLRPLTVILGPNSAGKSNLLDLIGLLSRLATAETVREAFDQHRGRPLEAFYANTGFGPAGYESRMQTDTVAFSVECDLELHPRIVREINEALESREKLVGSAATYTRVSETRLRYTLEVALHPRSGELFVRNESLRALRKDGEPRTSRGAFFELDAADDGSTRFVARIERQSHPRYFEKDRPRTLLKELSDPVYHPHVVAAARELASWRVYYVEPARARADTPVQAAEDPGRAGELLAAFYFTLQQRNRPALQGIVHNLRSVVAGITDLRVEVRDGLLEIFAIQEGGAEFPARLLSEGTLRLLCILGIAVAPTPPSMVCYEEPENGVNPARLDVLLQIVRNAVYVRPEGSQFLLTTHSAAVCNLLPDHLVLAHWDAGRGSQFEPLSIEKDTLYFQDAVVRVIDGWANALAVAEKPKRGPQ